MRIKTNGNKGDQVTLVGKNAEASATISRGFPACLVLNATDDGVAVVLPATDAAAKAHSLFYGIALADVTFGNTGEFQAYGFNRGAAILRGTRAASSDSWTSSASLPVGQILIMETINNCMVSSGGTMAASAFLPYCLLAETLTNIVASASSTSDTRTAITTLAKVFLRAL